MEVGNEVGRKRILVDLRALTYPCAQICLGIAVMDWGSGGWGVLQKCHWCAKEGKCVIANEFLGKKRAKSSRNDMAAGGATAKARKAKLGCFGGRNTKKGTERRKTKDSNTRKPRQARVTAGISSRCIGGCGGRRIRRIGCLARCRGRGLRCG